MTVTVSGCRFIIYSAAKALRISLFACGAVVVNVASVHADSGAGSDKPASVNPGNRAPVTQVLTGGASIVHVELGNVRDILLDVRRAKVAASHLYGEVTRHPITSYNYVDAMGPVMMEIPMPTFDMSEVLPARQSWVELYMNEITPALSYIKVDGAGIKNGEDSLNFSDKVKSRFDELFQDASASIDKAADCGTKLQKLTVAPPYDNLAIAKQISELHKDLRDVERTTKHLIGEIKKSNSK